MNSLKNGDTRIVIKVNRNSQPNRILQHLVAAPSNKAVPGIAVILEPNTYDLSLSYNYLSILVWLVRQRALLLRLAVG